MSLVSLIMPTFNRLQFLAPRALIDAYRPSHTATDPGPTQRGLG